MRRIKRTDGTARKTCIDCGRSFIDINMMGRQRCYACTEILRKEQIRISGENFQSRNKDYALFYANRSAKIKTFSRRFMRDNLDRFIWLLEYNLNGGHKNLRRDATYILTKLKEYQVELEKLKSEKYEEKQDVANSSSAS